MTERANDDPRRALDAVTPPDQWDDIVARSQHAEVIELADARPSGRGRWALGAVAAVLVLVVAAVGVVALIDGDDEAGDRDRLAAAPQASPWGERWELTALTRDGVDWPLAALDGRSPELDLTIDGTIGYRACNRAGGEGRIDDGRLVLDDGFFSTVAGCIGPDEATANEFMDQEAFVQELLRGRPTVERDGDRLTVAAGDDSATFTRMDDREPSAMFGRRWSAVDVQVDGFTRDLHAAGGLVLRFEGEEATFPDLTCWSPYAGPLEGDRWSPVATVDYDCGAQAPDERKEWLSRLFAGTEVDGEAPSPLTVEVAGDGLVLANGSTRITFVETLEPAAVVGPVWTVTRVEDGGVEKELVSRDDADGITFLVRGGVGDGSGSGTGLEFTLSGGCNVTFGGLAMVGDRFVVGESFGSTYALCSGPGPAGDALMDQDAWFTAFLADDPLVLLQGDHLTLWTAEARVDMEGDGSVGAPIDSPDDGGGSTGSATETTTGPDGSVGGPLTSVPVTPSADPGGLGPAEGLVRIDGAVHGCGPGDGSTVEVQLSGVPSVPALSIDAIQSGTVIGSAAIPGAGSVTGSGSGAGTGSGPGAGPVSGTASEPVSGTVEVVVEVQWVDGTPVHVEVVERDRPDRVLATAEVTDRGIQCG